MKSLEKLKNSELYQSLLESRANFEITGSSSYGTRSFFSDIDILVIKNDEVDFNPRDDELDKLRSIGVEFHIFLKSSLLKSTLDDDKQLVFYDSAFRLGGDFYSPYVKESKRLKAYTHLWSYLSSLRNFNYLIQNKIFCNGCKTPLKNIVHFKFLYHFNNRRSGLFSYDLKDFFKQNSINSNSDFFNDLHKKNYLINEVDSKKNSHHLISEFHFEANEYLKIYNQMLEFLNLHLKDTDSSYYLGRIENEKKQLVEYVIRSKTR